MAKKTKKLWHKGRESAHSLVEKYTSGEDILLDQKLVAYDIYGSVAHATMLQKIGVLTRKELDQIKKELSRILKLYDADKYMLRYDDEDVHTRIENDLTQKYPKAGGRIHTGRSRNDQILVDMRLFAKDNLHEIVSQTISVIETFIKFAKEHEFVPMPGYTHMQQAMLSSVGLWSAQFAESLLDDLEILESAYRLNDQSPLGSGAAYGVSLPIDRNLTAKLLGFSKVQNNSLYCQNSRGKIEGNVVHAFLQIMLTLSKFSQDILLFTTAEFDFLLLPDELTTGSSIMPQKKNVDIMELVRAKAKTMQAYEVQILSVGSGLPSGYNRDLQETKMPYMNAFGLILETLKIVRLVIVNLAVKKQSLLSAISKDLYATHCAYQLVKNQGMPFRQAYRQVGKSLDKISDYDPKQVLKETSHAGAPGNLRLVEIEKRVLGSKKQWGERKKIFEQKLKKLIQ